MLQHRIITPNDAREHATDDLIAALPEWRRQQALRFKYEQGRRECALSYLLLSDMLGYQPEFTVGEHGKPGIKGGSIYFNLSHCRNAIACVVSDSPCGIDVECLGRYKPAVAEYSMSDEEMRMIREAEDSDAEFTWLWTRKEALLKLTGEGITDDMKTCLTSERMAGMTMESGIDKENGYAWSVCRLNKA